MPAQNCVWVRVSGCRVCLSLSLLVKGGRDITCMRCDQGDDLLSMVEERKEEVERLTSIRECEQEVNWWIISLPYPQERHLGDTSQTEVVSLP